MRLKGHDYAEPGYYFVTVTTEHGACLFGCVRNAIMSASPAGEMVEREWDALSRRFAGVEWDSFCIMPNHVHGLVGIGVGDDVEAPGISVPTVIQAFKSITTLKYGVGVRESEWPPYVGRLWHSGYHDHIVRTERELDRIRAYIAANPANWNEDRFFDVGQDRR
jgi:putative transposase